MREHVMLLKVQEKREWFVLLLGISKITIAPGHRVGHLHMGLTTDVLHFLPEKERSNFPD